MDILKPYRKRIDIIDAQILELLRRRYDIIDEVGHLKARNGIPATIKERVDEVRQNAERMAGEKGLDVAFVGKLYAQLIEHSCDMEEDIIKDRRVAATSSSLSSPRKRGSAG